MRQMVTRVKASTNIVGRWVANDMPSAPQRSRGVADELSAIAARHARTDFVKGVEISRENAGGYATCGGCDACSRAT
jgi:hypothetical protein